MIRPAGFKINGQSTGVIYPLVNYINSNHPGRYTDYIGIGGDIICGIDIYIIG